MWLGQVRVYCCCCFRNEQQLGQADRVPNRIVRRHHPFAGQLARPNRVPVDLVPKVTEKFAAKGCHLERRVEQKELVVCKKEGPWEEVDGRMLAVAPKSELWEVDAGAVSERRVPAVRGGTAAGRALAQ